MTEQKKGHRVKIEATKDFKRPRASVLQKFRNQARFEEVLKGMRATTERTSEAPDMAWACSVVYREEPRRFALKAQETAPDETFVVVLDSELAQATIQMDFYDLPDGGCRVISTAEMIAHTVVAKLALQSLRLVRGKAEERLARFVGLLGRP